MAAGSQINGTVPQGTFGVTQDDKDPSGPAAYPITTPMGVINPTVTGGGSGGSSSSGGSSVASSALGAAGTIGGSLVGGPIGGFIGGTIGKLFGGLFAKGGLVTHGDEMADGGLVDKITRIDTLSADRAASDRGERAAGSPSRSFSSIAANDKPMQLKAEGGPIEEPDQNHDPLAIGYLVGALHQKKYGGTPKTLADAANEIKEMLAGGGSNESTPRFASGGATEAVEPKTTASTPQKSFSSYDDLASYYGESSTGDSNSVGGDTTTQSSMPTSTPTTNTLYPSTQTADTTSTKNTAPEADPVSLKPDIQRGSYKAAQGGYMAQGYAAGGPPQEQPPLQAGQQFQGDGSVKGPGGPQDDAIPAKLSNGEFVMSQPAVQFFGVDKLNQMNEKGKQGFMQMMQQGDQGAAPGQPPQGMPQAPPQMPPQPPMKNGGSVMRIKGSGYAGL